MIRNKSLYFKALAFLDNHDLLPVDIRNLKSDQWPVLYRFYDRNLRL